MSNKIALLIAVVVAIVACVQAQPSRPSSSFYRIVRGDEIEISDVPYQVSLQYLNIHHCGGSILNKKWILTAAHCTKRAPASRLKVRLGSSEHASGGTVVQIKRIVEHPKYDDITVDYDFSLMELETEISFSDVIQPVTLPEQDEPVEAGTTAIVSGWGDTRKVTESNTALRAANVSIMSQEECINAYSVHVITDRMMCAGYKQGGKDSCTKDFGSPLVADGKLVGLASWGYSCGTPRFPGVYGRVASVSEWIRENSGL